MEMILDQVFGIFLSCVHNRYAGTALQVRP